MTDSARLLLERLAAKGVAIDVDGGELRIRAPKGVITAALRTEIAGHKRELIEVLSGALSFAQQRMWFLDRLEGPSSTYNIPACAWLDGPLDVAALEAALRGVMDRHAILRTVYPDVDGSPASRVLERAEFPFSMEDVSSASDPEAAVVAMAREWMLAPFDLARGPLLRARLVCVSKSKDRHALFVCVHHIAADGWSMGILLREAIALYESITLGSLSSLEPLRFQYADFARAQRERLSGEPLRKELAYWREKLAGAPQVLELPTDRPRPAVQSYRGATEWFRIDAAQSARLREVARASGATLFMTLLAAFQVLLHRFSNQERIVVGCPIANRNRPEVEPLIGFFVNTLVLQSDFSSNPTFLEHLERVRRETLEAYDHQDLPFEKLVAELSPDRSLAHSPLFQVMFQLQSTPGILRMKDVVVTPFKTTGRTAKFDLYVALDEAGDELLVEWEYATDLFDAETMKRMFACFRTLLSAVAENPAEKVSRLRILDSQEESRIVRDWNRTDVAYETDRTLVDLVEEGVARFPERTAVVWENERVTYAELDARANRMARHLQAMVDPAAREPLIGICLPRSIEMIVAILGVLKSGAAYVPLDPAYPAERIEFMMEDAAMPLLITHSSVAPRGREGTRVVAVDLARDEFQRESASPPRRAIAPEQLAYVIYTSGSTGRPKGILIEHRNTVALLHWARTVFTDDELRGTLASTSLCFDLSIFEIFLPLMTGGTVIVAENALALPRIPARDEVTLINTVPSAIAELIRGGGIPSSVVTVNLAGEPLKAPLADRIYELRHIRNVYDLYGPGEDTTYSTYARRERKGRETVGRPIHNSQAYILDRELRPVPIGVAGEIFMGGAGVTRGYGNRPELTAERYLPDPFSDRPGARMYKTGDLGRWYPDGNIEYLGRLDHQVKIRGFRIELGEIENALLAHPGVRECVVQAGEIPASSPDRSAGKRLIAYYAGDAGVDILRNYLGGKLPGFMVPSIFLRMETLPMTPNGKIDRKALPDPDAGCGASSARTYIAPRTPAERVLADAWAVVLGRDRVGVTDNFFEIGGDSILAIQIIGRVRRDGLVIAPHQIFQHQTVAELAAASTSVLDGPAEETLRGEVGFTPAQARFFARHAEGFHHYAQYTALDLPSGATKEIVEAALSALVAHHDALRLRFERRGDTWTQRCVSASDAGRIVVEEVCAARSETEVAATIREAADRIAARFDLERGPLVGAALMAGGSAPRVLLVIHHLLVDGVSWRILFEDFAAACSALIRGGAVELPARTSSLGRWSDALRGIAASDELNSERGRWLEEGESLLAPLPRDLAKVAGNGTYGDTAEIEVVLEEDATRALLEDIPAAYNTGMTETLLAALGAAISAWTGEGRVLVELEGHGRAAEETGLDLSRTVGWFTSYSPVSILVERADDSSAIDSVLTRVKETLRARRRAGIGHGLFAHLHPDAAIREKFSRLPRPEIVLNYLGRLDRALVTTSEDRYAFAAAGLAVAPSFEREHVLEVAAALSGGRLRARWIWNAGAFDRATIERVAADFQRRLVALADHARSAWRPTPSDFPDVTIPQAELDRLLSRDGFRRNVEAVLPLTPTQEGILFHSLAANDPAMYLTQLAFRVRSTRAARGAPFDPEAFHRAWRTVVARHAALRACFAQCGSRDAVQVVLREAVVPWTVVEMDSLTEAERGKAITAFLREDAARGFALETAPLMRVSLLRLEANETIVVWTGHHLILDGWSLANVLKEVVAVYSAGKSGYPLRLDPVSPYRDQIWRLALPADSSASAYWREELAGFVEPTPLPIPSASDRKARAPIAESRAQIPEATVTTIETFARRNHVTLNTVLQAAWALLLARTSGHGDVVFGEAVSGRHPDLPGVESMVGLFINTVPVRIRVPDDMPVRVWLEELQSRRGERDAFSRTPLVAIQTWCGVRRGTPLFESLLILENYPIDASLRAAPEGLVFDDVRVFEKTNYPLTVAVTPGREIQLKATFDAARFDPEAVEGMLARYVTTLFNLTAAEEGAGRPRPYDRMGRDIAVSEIGILSLDEEARILNEWNATRRDYRSGLTLMDLFEEQVARTPNACALTFGNSSITYVDLDRRANHLARRLQREGVTGESLVGVMMERSLEMVVALYGILKAGGAYVPIDPEYPEERVRFMLADSGVRILVTSPGTALGIPDFAGKVLALEPETVDSETGDSDPIPRAVTPDSLAYMIYTSGSTGRPKGALNTHRGIVNRLLWMQEAFSLDASDAVLQKTPFSFDVSVWEFFWPLQTGARLVIAEPGGHRDPAYLASVIAREGITTIHFVPSMLAAFLEFRPPGNLPLKRVITSGEALTANLRDRCFESLTAELHNLYGPTEAAVDVTWWPCRRGDRDPVVPIGRPIANTTIYVLDRSLRHVPVGVAGELYIGGVQVGIGYHNRPELTAERFVLDPFSTTSGARMYRTGDLARYRDDGVIEYLGRLDDQVKIRGVRIELGEIESALRAHPDISEAIVMVRETSDGPELRAFYTVRDGAENLRPDLAHPRAHLARSLPESMIPARFIRVDELPLTPSGKVDRRALMTMDESAEAPRAVDDAAPLKRDVLSRAGPPAVRGAEITTRPASREIEETIAGIWKEVLGVERVGPNENFFDLGGHSIRMMRAHARLGEVFGTAVPALAELFEYPTVAALARRVAGDHASSRRSVSETREPAKSLPSADIAIIGMSGRFPGANSIEEFWENLRNGVESVRAFSDEELRAAGVSATEMNDPAYVRSGAVLDEADAFDAEFFGFSPREAELLDPQQRVFLEVAWSAFEAAGYNPRELDRPAGVFAGSGLNTYLIRNIASRPDVVEAAGAFQILVSGDKDYLPTRVSYKLDLRGPSVNVQTACSTSLVAVYMACESLRKGDCGIALAGGVSLRWPRTAGYLYQEGMIFSPDGHCRAFDARAGGMVAGSGAAAVVLKRLEDAMKDGDTIHAVIKGAAINNDGAFKVGYTAPSVEGQAAVIAEAIDRAGVPAESISYVEAHGTGTPLGDPIEVAALTKAFRSRGSEATARTGFCALGSVKTNVGHLDAAAGVTGLIKAVLALKHREIPPSLHCDSPNPAISIEKSPFFVNSALRQWTSILGPRRAGVSSFGIGGTNAHVILEEAPVLDPPADDSPIYALPLSARSHSALESATDALAEFLRQPNGPPIGDVAFTLSAGRASFAHRRLILANSAESAVASAATRDAEHSWTGIADEAPPSVVFLFSGQGAQYPGMMRELYDREPEFREELDLCDRILASHIGVSIVKMVFVETSADAQPPIHETRFTQPILFAFEYALARLWMRRGVQPAACIGHSIGEYVAACLAGVFSLEDALAIVAARGRLMQSRPPGAMIAVPLEEGEVVRRLEPGCELAALNAPDLCVVSGPAEAVTALEGRLTREEIEVTRLRTSHAFHSAMMDPILAEFEAVVRGFERRAPTLPFLSNLTGEWISGEEARDPKYWARQLRGTVRFSPAMARLLDGGISSRAGKPRPYEGETHAPRLFFLEVGPGRSLTNVALRHARNGVPPSAIASSRSIRDERGDTMVFAEAAAKLWVEGVPVDWSAWHSAGARRRVPLPTYPFERKRFWIEPRTGAADVKERQPQSQIEDWFRLPSWQRALPPSMTTAVRHAILFLDAAGCGEALAGVLEARGARVTRVRAGEGYGVNAPGDYSIDPGSRPDYDALIATLAESGPLPDAVWHCWLYDAADAGAEPSSALNGMVDRAFFSLVCFAQSLVDREFELPSELEGGETPPLRTFGTRRVTGGKTPPLRMVVVSRGMHRISGLEPFDPFKALALGPSRVIPQEDPRLRIVSVDLDEFASDAPGARQRLDAVLSEIDSDGAAIVAHRAASRWVRSFATAPISSGDIAQRLRPSGVYLITGGLGGVGHELALGIARAVPNPKLVLVARSSDTTPERSARIAALVAAGAEVAVYAGDVADEARMREILTSARARFGAIRGVVHAAGVPGGGLIAARTREAVEAEFAAKVRGTLVLDRVLGDDPIDWIVYCSSTNAFVGGVGQAAYSAANAFQDAFAEQCAARGDDRLVVSINWDRWRGIGMAKGVEALTEQLTGSRLEGGLTADEGREVFARVLSAAAGPRVIVSVRDFDRVVRESSTSSLGGGASADGVPEGRNAMRADRSRHARPDVKTEFVAAATETEVAIARTWQEAFGIDRIGIRDDFARLGGDSLLAVRIAGRLRKELGVPVSVRTVYEYPTVERLAIHVDTLRCAKDAAPPSFDIRVGGGTASNPDAASDTVGGSPNGDRESGWI